MSTFGGSLHFAAAVGDEAEVQRLISNGENTNAQNACGWTPLHVASGTSAKVVRMLVDNGSNIEAKDQFGWTPIYYAIIAGEEDVISTLMDLGADIDTSDLKSQTPFVFAISIGQIGPAQILLDAGAKTAPAERAFFEHLKANGLRKI